MNDVDDAFERLRAIDPAQTAHERPDAASFLAQLETSETEVVPVDGPSRTLGVRHLTLAAASLAGIALLVAIVWLAAERRTVPDVLNPADVTVDMTGEETGDDRPTTAPPTSTTPTTAPAEIDAATRALLDRFESTYNSGDPDALLALLQPGMNREVVVDRDRRLYSQDFLRDLLLIEADLHTEISLECEAGSDPTAVTCVATRFDDLHRILDIPGTEEVPWTFRFDDDGLVRGWTERREQVVGVDNYEREAYRPLADWARENHPDVAEGGLKPAVAGEWVVSKRADIVAMVAAFAESRGVTLDPDR